MNVALAFCKHDAEQARRWFAWCQELGGVKRHDLFVMPSADCNAEASIFRPAEEAFRSVTIVPDRFAITSDWSQSNAEVRDASGPNSAIRQLAWHFYSLDKGPWMFVEPDAIPLCPDWLDRIEAEYLASGKRYMGAVVRIPNVPVHSTGNMVLPQDAAVSCQSLMLPRHAKIGGKYPEIAFDVAAAHEVLQNHHETKLIQHVFRGPSFTSKEQFERDVSPDAVLFHTCKDGSLIPFLREKMGWKTNPEWERLGPEADIHFAYHKDAFTPLPEQKTEPANNIVYTYFEPVPSMDRAEQEWLLSRWAESWSKHGWTTVILSEKDATTNPHFDNYKAMCQSLPSVNPPEYELACYLRHMAMVQRGGGVLTDYDVLNYGFAPEDVPKHEGKWPLMLADKNPCPCAVVGTAKQYNKFCHEILDNAFKCVTKERGKPHVSDQQLVQMWKLPAVDICFQYGRPGWQHAKLVHYSHGGCGGRKRSEVIPSAEQMRAIDSTAFVKALIPEDSFIAEVTKPLTLADHIAAIKTAASKDNLSFARIAKQLRAAGLIPQKAKKRKASR